MILLKNLNYEQIISDFAAKKKKEKKKRKENDVQRLRG
jgi:hypothetical protein